VENDPLVRKLLSAGGVLLDKQPATVTGYLHTGIGSAQFAFPTDYSPWELNTGDPGQTVDHILAGKASFAANGNSFSLVGAQIVEPQLVRVVPAGTTGVWWESDEVSTDNVNRWVAHYALFRLRGEEPDPPDRPLQIASQGRRGSVLHDFWTAATRLSPELARVLFVSLNEFHGGPAAFWALGIRDERVLADLTNRAGIGLADEDLAAVREFSELFLGALAVGAPSAHLVALARQAIRWVASRVVLSVRALGTAAIARMRMLSSAIQRHAPPVSA
jgi:hypothetical protein